MPVAWRRLWPKSLTGDGDEVAVKRSAQVSKHQSPMAEAGRKRLGLALAASIAIAEISGSSRSAEASYVMPINKSKRRRRAIAAAASESRKASASASASSRSQAQAGNSSHGRRLRGDLSAGMSPPARGQLEAARLGAVARRISA